jgi:hypothetical protein
MFDKVSQAAEKLATNVSRRAFFGRVGRGALVVAGVLGATLALPGQGQAKGTTNKLCFYSGGYNCRNYCVRCDEGCPPPARFSACRLISISACTCNGGCSRC